MKTPCLFATDLHGSVERYTKLFAAIADDRPVAVFLGGDLLPGGSLLGAGPADFVESVLAHGLTDLRERLGLAYPRVFVIPGNDDSRAELADLEELQRRGLWQLVHGRRLELGSFEVFGYAYVPPTPFSLKDWERYDVSRYVDPGCVSPEEGWRSVPIDPVEARTATIERDLDLLTGDHDLGRAVLLFHSPPYDTCLDRAALDGKSIDHAPLDVHVGSIAIQRFIQARQPLLTLHGHVHEAARITGSWRELIGRTHALGAAHDGPELALVRVDLDDPASASREVI